ncbi:LCP family protein [Paenibacillus sp. GCM10012307]|uniref:LCP family protein n=1 Tax=Paenibacillus roseus TaxID=2798579 RepID=A0A934IYP5_9BACL|nr:LCP family protein [Paenibacillus roseus]MBJ6361667.1 LCP family protein [Paenibacillus roseus]
MRRFNKKVWLPVLIVAIVLLGCVGYFNRTALALWGFDHFLSNHVENQLVKSYQPLQRLNQNKPEKKLDEVLQKPMTMLLLGVDQRDKERGRSDTMIVSVVRPKDGALLLLSIPRDAYVDIPGRKSKDKITHAYAFGQANLAVKTVEELLDTKIDHYAAINFQGFREAIDALGGITLPIDKDIVNKGYDHEKFTIKGGQERYNGTDTLNYVRYREDAGGDSSRAGRHQIFITTLMNEATHVSQWSKLPGLFAIMGDNFTTDLKPEQIIGLGKSMLGKHDVYSYTLNGEGRRLVDGGPWYYFLNDQDVKQAKQWIKSWKDDSLAQNQLPLPNSEQSDKE